MFFKIYSISGTTITSTLASNTYSIAVYDELGNLSNEYHNVAISYPYPNGDFWTEIYKMYPQNLVIPTFGDVASFVKNYQTNEILNNINLVYSDTLQHSNIVNLANTTFQNVSIGSYVSQKVGSCGDITYYFSNAVIVYGEFKKYDYTNAKWVKIGDTWTMSGQVYLGMRYTFQLYKKLIPTACCLEALCNPNDYILI